MSAPPFAIAIVSVSTGQSVLLPSVQSGDRSPESCSSAVSAIRRLVKKDAG